MYLSNICGCFSEGSPEESKIYTCDGNVCVLKTPKKENLGKPQTLSHSKKSKHGLHISFPPRAKRSHSC
ncbi:hypothetical protein glysoja_003934 [Glycine soja]|nr:hypothetical protein JHK86_005739 [Glycine max]KHN38269.1 hypothetical protein glysoja_003934 [Glycine soja]